MKKTILLLIIISALLPSCSQNKVFEKYTKLDNNKWKRDNLIRFDVDIKDVNTNYDVTLALRHTTYYAFANIKVNVTLTFPSGDMRTRDYDIFIRNSDGSFKGEGAGDLWDITYPVFNDITFPDVGTYKFEVQNVMPIMELPDVMDVGLIVRKAEKKSN
ncbi:MAG: gliding motility lipoprotein GldH [Bacteroidota bacterium]